MARLGRIGTGLLFLSLAAGAAMAGANGGGTLIAVNAQIQYTSDYTSFCGRGTIPTSCATASTRLDNTFNGGNVSLMVWKVYAAFPDGSSPRLKGLTFGVTYTKGAGGIAIPAGDFASCIGDPNQGALEIYTTGWPDPGTGASLIFQNTQTQPLDEIYWFAGYNYDGTPSRFTLTPHPDPNLGGNFVDDSAHPVSDPIAGYGSLGFDEDGAAACPLGTGACCDLKHGTCSIQTLADCNALGNHDYMGTSSCSPNPCPTRGPCCMGGLSQTCQQMNPDSCVAQGNAFLGLCGQTCPGDPPCPLGQLGACCTDTTCVLEAQGPCGNNIFLLNYLCAPNPCTAVWGACCTDTDCRVLKQPDCNSFWFQGVTCLADVDNPCLRAYGSCCDLSGHCVISFQSNCASNFTFRQNRNCDDLCGTPTVTTTWGQIKNKYK